MELIVAISKIKKDRVVLRLIKAFLFCILDDEVNIAIIGCVIGLLSPTVQSDSIYPSKLGKVGTEQ